MTDEAAGGVVLDPPVGGGLLPDSPVSGNLSPGQGMAGAPGASAYALAGGDAVWGSLTAWLASLAVGGAIERNYAVAVAYAGQTRLPITPPPSALSTVVLTINGLGYRAPLALSVTEVAITWKGDFQLDPDDDINVSYF